MLIFTVMFLTCTPVRGILSVKITLTHSRREKHAIISRNGQQNMTIIGIKLEEVLLLQNKKRS